MARRIEMMLWLAVLAGAVGCTHLPEGVSTTAGFSAPGTPYGDSLLRHTRKAELYEGFDTIGKGWATWKSAELRRVLAEASIQAYELKGDAAGDVRRQADAAAAGPREFHLALYTPKKQWNDLEAGDTLWRAMLELPDRPPTAPLRIEAVAKTDKTPVQYPYITPWTREYTLVFPAAEEGTGTAPPVLVLQGPLGTMRYDFSRPAGP